MRTPHPDRRLPPRAAYVPPHLRNRAPPEPAPPPEPPKPSRWAQLVPGAAAEEEEEVEDDAPQAFALLPFAAYSAHFDRPAPTTPRSLRPSEGTRPAYVPPHLRNLPHEHAAHSLDADAPSPPSFWTSTPPDDDDMARGGPRGRGRGRGGYGGGFDPFPGAGRTLDSPDGGLAPRGGFRGGRGGGRGRGTALAMRGQNAVGFDYASLSRPRGPPPLEGPEGLQPAAPAAPDSDGDVVITPRRGYVHVHRPQHERPVERAYDASAPGASRHALHGADLATMLPPTGPKAMQRSGGHYVPAGGTSRRGGRGAAPVFPHFDVPQRAHRPSEDIEAQMLAGLGLSKGGVRQFRAGDPAAARHRPMLQPVAFVRSTGIDKQREGEGLQEASVEALAQGKSGRGLGFSDPSAPQQVLPESKPPMQIIELDSDIGDDDDMAALLAAYPDTRELEAHEESIVHDPLVSELPEFAHAAASAEPSQVESDDEEDVVLVTHTSLSSAPSGPMEDDAYDSEEDRQLEAVIAAGEAAGLSASMADTAPHAPIEVDLTGDDELPEPEAEPTFYIDTEASEPMQVEQSATEAAGPALGDPAAPAARSVEAEVEYSSDDAPNMTQRQPRGPGKKARNSAKKARRRQKGKNGELRGFEEPPQPREGDSDLEWGSDGPPKRKGVNGAGGDAVADELRRGLTLGASGAASAGSSKAKQQQAVLDDLAELAANDVRARKSADDDGDSDLDRETELDGLLRFMNSMDGQRAGRQMTLDDIAIEERMASEDEWMTEDSGDEDATEIVIDEERTTSVRIAVEQDEETEEQMLAVEERIILDSDSDDSSEDSSGDDDMEVELDLAMLSRGRKGKGKKAEILSDSDSDSDSDEDSDSDDSDDDDDLPKGFSWADRDEDFIAKLDRYALEHDDVLKGRDRKARNKIFRAIERGEFDDFEKLTRGAISFDMDLDSQPVKGGHAGRKKWDDGSTWAENLQGQWEKDRATKAANKRKRAAERAAAAENPFHNTHKKGTKKAQKKAARAERRNGAAFGFEEAPQAATRGFGGVGGPASGESVLMLHHAVNLHELDLQIQQFLRDPAHTTLSLAPMDKRARAQVHMLAAAYSLTSKSVGDGAKRFPTLVKNARSGQNVNIHRVRGVLSGRDMGFGKGAPRRDGKKGAKNKSGAAAAAGASVARNQDGAEVGYGAEKISEDNIGHKLLTMMGWKEGSGVGHTPGSASAVGATIKISKGGLGF